MFRVLIDVIIVYMLVQNPDQESAKLHSLGQQELTILFDGPDGSPRRRWRDWSSEVESRKLSIQSFLSRSMKVNSVQILPSVWSSLSLWLFVFISAEDGPELGRGDTKTEHLEKVKKKQVQIQI